jgi:hypothetical protein
MKVSIGPYKNWIGPYQIADKIFFWVKKYPITEEQESRWDYKLHDRFGAWLAGTWVNSLCNWIHSKKGRKIAIRIDKYDTWGMEHTLALIILPMLIQLKENKHGAPYVDDEYVPEELRSTSVPSKENEWDTDDNHFKRWDWVLNEMIYAFECEANEDWENQFYSGEHDIEWIKRDGNMSEMTKGPKDTFKIDREAMDKAQKRCDNGRMLFAKYYNSLWD